MKAPLPDALHIDAAAPGEEERIRPLFREVFKVDIGPEMVRWKYGEAPGIRTATCWCIAASSTAAPWPAVMPFASRSSET